MNTKICIAGLNRRAGYATGRGTYRQPEKLHRKKDRSSKIIISFPSKTFDMLKNHLNYIYLIEKKIQKNPVQ